MLAIDALPGDPVEQLAFALQVDFNAMKSIEGLHVQLGQQAKHVEGIVGARQGEPPAVAQRWDAAKAHVDRLLLEPFRDQRLELKAPLAAVVEKIGDLDPL